MRAKSTFLLFWIAGVVLPSRAETLAQDYVNESRTIVGTPQSTTERFNFTLKEDDPYPNFELTIQMSQGRRDLRIPRSSRTSAGSTGSPRMLI